MSITATGSFSAFGVVRFPQKRPFVNDCFIRRRMGASVKGCAMPAPPRAGLAVREEPGGQASDKPRGRKPRGLAMRLGKPTGLWGFDGAHSR